LADEAFAAVEQGEHQQDAPLWPSICSTICSRRWRDTSAGSSMTGSPGSPCCCCCHWHGL
ncbi:MAG: hypothetical protein IJ879_04665, partial [Muribaculaceae bacterium]|nr:hypothetical protein [Muribaculaceae bacterium]